MEPKEDLIPVEGHDGWYRDPSSNAIVNCDTNAYEDYMAKYNARQRKKDKDNTFCCLGQNHLPGVTYGIYRQGMQYSKTENCPTEGNMQILYKLVIKAYLCLCCKPA